MSKKKQRCDNRPAINEDAKDGLVLCRLCDSLQYWKSGAFTRHLRTCHQLSITAYYLRFFGDKWQFCLCSCGQTTTWEPREGYYKGYVSGHNYRGKTKENDASVAVRASKMVLSESWKASCFAKGLVPWNKLSTDLEYLRRLFKKPKQKLTTKGIRKGIYLSTKTGNQHYYDSGWELERMQWYDTTPTVLTWARCEDLLPYVDCQGQTRHYNPDFVLRYDTDNHMTVEEIKGGLFGPSTYQKLLAASKHYAASGTRYNVLTKRHKKFILVPFELFNTEG